MLLVKRNENWTPTLSIKPLFGVSSIVLLDCIEAADAGCGQANGNKDLEIRVILEVMQIGRVDYFGRLNCKRILQFDIPLTILDYLFYFRYISLRVLARAIHGLSEYLTVLVFSRMTEGGLNVTISMNYLCVLLLDPQLRN
jgi:hypothetical protein